MTQTKQPPANPGRICRDETAGDVDLWDVTTVEEPHWSLFVATFSGTQSAELAGCAGQYGGGRDLQNGAVGIAIVNVDATT